MKKIGLMVLSAALALLAVTGCKTATYQDPGTGLVVTNRVPDVALMTGVAKSAAYLGTEIYLQGIPPGVPGHPEARPAFEAARNSLAALVAAGTFSASDLTAALQNLPVKELQGAQGSLVVGEAVILWDEYGQQLANLDKAKVFPTYILPVAQALLDGLNMALGPATSPPATPTPAK
jgi:hypothetical protein